MLISILEYCEKLIVKNINYQLYLNMIIEGFMLKLLN